MIKRSILLIAVCIVSIHGSFAQPSVNDTTGMEIRLDKIISQLTLEEKASLCSGRDAWSTKPIERLHIPWIWLSDGPHGLRRAPATDMGGYGDQHPATCFPTASALASTWDVNLIYQVGQALGEECQALHVNILLGPGVNIKRHPLGGRNFEYFSEDPILAGEMGAAMINGIQSQGVGASLKHFALNNEEYMRMLTSSDVDQRTLHELYLVPFEIAVKKAHPWTIMASYNRINGIYATQNKYLLTDVLRNEWGYKGTVISDWCSVVDRVEGLKAGMNLEMPGSGGVNDALIVQAVKDGQLSEKVLDENVRHILRTLFIAKAYQKHDVELKTEVHYLLARKVASEAITLLKNEQQILPLTSKYKTIAIIGEFAKHSRYQGNGSSEVKPTKLDTTYNEILTLAGNTYRITYAQGYSISDEHDSSKIDEAKIIAGKADIAIIFAGLPSYDESEGTDRKNIDLPAAQNKLITEIATVQKNTAVVLSNGSAVAMPWAGKVRAIIEAWLGGQAGGGAIADVLFGKVNPSGKLAESFPVRLEDTPAFLNFPGEARNVYYGERIFVGYRYYDIKGIQPLFPFGFGLSYTTFAYSGIRTSARTFTDKDTLSVSFTITNTGKVAGKEVAQLYISPISATVQRPVKELKKFTKLELQPGESKKATFQLSRRDFSYYDTRRNMWVAESGRYVLMAGASSRDIRLTDTVVLQSTQILPLAFDEYTFFNEYWRNPRTHDLTLTYFKDWIKQNVSKGQNLESLNINPFFMDMPIIKFPYLTKGLISKEKIDEFLKKVREIDQ